MEQAPDGTEIRTDFEMMPRGRLRWISRNNQLILQQEYEDGWGKPFWRDVPLVKLEKP